MSLGVRKFSYLGLQSAVIYRAYRLGQDSCAIAGELGIQPCAVRQFLFRANRAARKLGFDCGPRHHSAGRPRK